MGDLQMAKDQLAQAIEEMKSGAIEPQEFYKKLMAVLANLDVTNEDLKGVTPHLLGFVNGLIKNIGELLLLVVIRPSIQILKDIEISFSICSFIKKENNECSQKDIFSISRTL